MSLLLNVIGIIAWLFALFAFTIAFTGTDIQFILSAVWGTFGAVCIGSAAILMELQKLRKQMVQGRTRAGATGAEPSGS